VILCTWLIIVYVVINCCRMSESTTFTIRAVLSDSEIRKIRLASKPATVDELCDHVKTTLNLEYPFVVMYEDKDFNNELITLEHMEDLQPFSTIRIIEVVSGEGASAYFAMNDNASSEQHGMRQSTANWPEEFTIPAFDHDIEIILSRGNADYVSCGKRMDLSKSAKGSILQKLVSAMYDIKAYPTESEFTSVAKSLVAKHPCLTESATKTGYDGWRNSLQFKMGNYRNDIRKAGGAELLINSGRRSRYRPDLPNGRSSIKKPRRGESNYLPNLPGGEDSSSQQDAQTVMKEECKKVRPDTRLLHSLMAKTFASRRQLIIKEMPPIAQVKENWPALFFPAEVSYAV